MPHPDIWREVYRVLKPGGHALVFAGTRTQDLMTISLRMAGFEVRDVIQHIFFSGFPKSHDVSKAFDRRAGAERKVVAPYKYDNRRKEGSGKGYGDNTYGTYGRAPKGETAPATDLAKQWSGWGTNLKPAHEPIIVVRKPLHDGKRKLTVVDCVEKYGTGAINIDGCRVYTDWESEYPPSWFNSGKGQSITWNGDDYRTDLSVRDRINDKGRFPANCITLDSDQFYSKYFNVAQANVTPAELSKKASKKDRNSDWQGEEITLEPKEADSSHFYGGLPDLRMESKQKRLPNANNHPTVKPTDLMAWLVRLITPPNGIVLDPFAGSGSTLVAAKREGFGFIGIELGGENDEYIPILEARTGVRAQ